MIARTRSWSKAVRHCFGDQLDPDPFAIVDRSGIAGQVADRFESASAERVFGYLILLRSTPNLHGL